MGFNGFSARKPRHRPHGELIAALDVGSSKIVCFIARVDEVGRPVVVGIGHQVSQGIKSGAVIDMEAAEQAIGTAVHAAEKLAGETIREAVINLSGGHPTSQTMAVEVAIAGHEVGEGDLRRALKAHNGSHVPSDSEIVHAIPVDYAIDGARGIRDPRGMYGGTLGVDLHLVTAAMGPVRNLMTCIGRSHLACDTLVVSPYAAGLACLVEDEKQLGCAVLDLGGGTTSLAVFLEGRMVFSDCIPVGGSHVTSDVARGLSTPLAHAERLKTLFGSCSTNLADDRESLHVPLVGEQEPQRSTHVPKSLLTGIIQPRMEEIFELVRGRLEASGFSKVAGRRVVLVGGGSQLQGVRELAQQVLDKQVRMGRPTPLRGLAEATAGPAFAVAVGLIGYAVEQPAEAALVGGQEDDVGVGFLSRLGGWFRDL